MKNTRLYILLTSLLLACTLAACGTKTVTVTAPTPSVVIPETAITPEGAKPQAPPPVTKQTPFSIVPIHIDKLGLHLIEQFEGYSRCAYWDPYGRVWTAGFGQTVGIHKEFCFKNLAAAEYNLQISIEKEYEWAIRGMGVPFNQHQWDALCSFAYNLGAGIFTGSLRYDLQHKLFNAAGNLMLQYDHAGGVVLAGLRIRRQDEVKLMLTPVAKVSKTLLRRELKAQDARRTKLRQLLAKHGCMMHVKLGHACTIWRREGAITNKVIHQLEKELGGR